MKIKKIIINDLYGYIDKEIIFNDDITILVGINGSGKTSILNIINWILKPSFSNLCVTEFKNIVLYFTYKNVDYEIECKHSNSTFTYTLKAPKSNDDYNPLVVKLDVSPSKILFDDVIKRDYMFRYDHLRPTKEEEKTWDFINSLPSPIVIGLDRYIFIEEKGDKLFIDTKEGRITRKTEIPMSPLSRVKELANTSYRKSKNEILNLTNNLKNHLMLSAFEDIISLDSIKKGLKQKLTVNQIELAENRFKNYLSKFEKTVFDNTQLKTITNYFSQLKKIVNEYQDNNKETRTEFLYSVNANQFLKLNNLLKEFERFEFESNKISANITLYLDTLNYFFKDSYKQLIFKEDTSEIKFNTINKNGEISDRYYDINNLSSGEQQILILFSYLAFNSEDGRIFIIDEPELSLHVKWQEDFLTSLEKLTSKASQIFLATHSPIIAGKKKNKAITLLPFNK